MVQLRSGTNINLFLFSRLISVYASDKIFVFPLAIKIINSINLYLDLVKVLSIITNFR